MAEELDVPWTDISVEALRCYVFPGGSTVEIKEPTKLHVSSSGGHRVQDTAGFGHYIPAGWIHLYWKPKDGQPIFVA